MLQSKAQPTAPRLHFKFSGPKSWYHALVQQAAYGGYAGGPASAAAGGGGASVWQEMQDDQGRTYYYNGQTGASQWEKPADA